MREASGNWDNADREDVPPSGVGADRVSDSAVDAADVAAKVVSAAVELSNFKNAHRRIDADDLDDELAGDPDQVTCDAMVIRSGFGPDVADAEIVDDEPTAKPATLTRPLGKASSGSVIDAEIVDDGESNTDVRGASPRMGGSDAPSVLRGPATDRGETTFEAADTRADVAASGVVGDAAHKAPAAEAKHKTPSPFDFLGDVGAEAYINGATPDRSEGDESLGARQSEADERSTTIDDAGSSPLGATPSVETPVGGTDGTGTGEVADDVLELDLDPEADADASPDPEADADPESEPDAESKKTDPPEGDDTDTDDGVRIGTMPVHPAAQKGLGIPLRYKHARELIADQTVLANLWDDLTVKQPVDASRAIPSPIPGRTADRVRIIDEDGTKVDLIRVNSHAQDPRYYVARDVLRKRPQGENIFVPNMPKTAWIHTGPEDMFDDEVTTIGVLRLLRTLHEVRHVRIHLAMETAALMDQTIARMDKRYERHIRRGTVKPSQPTATAFDQRKGNARNRHSEDRLRNAVSLHPHRGRQANPQNAARTVRAIRAVQAHREHNRAYNDIQKRINQINQHLKEEFRKDIVTYILFPSDRVTALREERAELERRQFGHSVTGRAAQAVGRRAMDIVGV